jgi:hypothetical protein
MGRRDKQPSTDDVRTQGKISKKVSILGDLKRRLGRIGHTREQDMPTNGCFRQSFMAVQPSKTSADDVKTVQTESLSNHSFTPVPLLFPGAASKDSVDSKTAADAMAAVDTKTAADAKLLTLYAAASDLDTRYGDWTELEEKPMPTATAGTVPLSVAGAGAGASASGSNGASVGKNNPVTCCYSDQSLTASSSSVASSAAAVISPMHASSSTAPSAYEVLDESSVQGAMVAAVRIGGMREVTAAGSYEVEPAEFSVGYENAAPAEGSAPGGSSGYEFSAPASADVRNPAASQGGSHSYASETSSEAGGGWLRSQQPAAKTSSTKSSLSWSKQDHTQFVEVMRRSNSELLRSKILNLLEDDESSFSGLLNLNTLADVLQQHASEARTIDYHWINGHIENLERFWTASSAEDVKASLKSLEKLARDFQQAARTYASIIISEMQTPNPLKTIPSSNVGGIAGGEKYIKNGILFKFAVDTCLRKEPTPLWMYGGSAPDDAKAAKAAGYELCNLVSFGTTYETQVKLPLICLIDHLGFRIIAVALLPLAPAGLIYGSNDGGKTVHADDTMINDLMGRAGSWLGLAPHRVRDVDIVGPGDIEVHRGSDGRYYALDFGRMMPPEAPTVDTTGKPTDPRSVFYKFLRPEMVRAFSDATQKRLCSDAFTAWNYFDTRRKQHEQDLIEATRMLIEKQTRECAEYLKSVGAYREFSEWFTGIRKSHERSVSSLAEVQLFLTRIQLDRWLHSHGVNVRYVGVVRQHYADTSVRCLLASVIVARVLKQQARASMRKLVRSTAAGTLQSEWPYKEEVASLMNKLLLSSDKLDEFWRTDIKVAVTARFPGTLSDEELAPNYDLRSSIDVRMCLLLFCEGLGIELDSETLAQIWSGVDVELYSFDINSIRVRVKATIEAYLATGILSWMTARDNPDNDSAVRLLRKAQSSFESMMKITSGCALSHSQYGNILVDLANRNKRPELKETYFRDALGEFNTSLDLRVLPITLSSYAAALTCYAAYKESIGELKLAEEMRTMSSGLTKQFEEVQNQSSSCERRAQMVNDSMQQKHK